MRRKPNPPQARDKPKQSENIRRSAEKNPLEKDLYRSPGKREMERALRLSAMKQEKAEERRNATQGNIIVNHRWKLLALLLLICPLVARQIGIGQAVRLADTLHDQAVMTLEAGTKCTSNKEGVSHGKICDVEGTTHFLKPVPIIKSSNETGKQEPISFEEFMRQFVQNNIGAKVPKARFFKETTMKVDKHFIGSEMIEGLKFANDNILTDKELGPQGVARLAVATTFIQDLHNKNWGYTKDGLILIDVDSAHNPPKTIKHYIDIAVAGLNPKEWAPYASFPLSVFNVRQMKDIYKKMLQTPLPKYHREFHLTKELYTEVLNLYINACQATIDYIRHARPTLKSNVPNADINNVLRTTIETLYLKNRQTNKP